MKLEHMTWPQVENYLKTKKTAIIPIGSTEQHGPTALIGTDFITAQHISNLLGEKTKTIVAPSLNYGMAQHHLAFCGTMSLTPATYIKVIEELVESLGHNGFENFLFINGHGGNIAPVTTAFSAIKSRDNNYKLRLESTFKLPEVVGYCEEHFPNENGMHATIDEVSLTKFFRPEAFDKIEDQMFNVVPITDYCVYSATEFRENFPDGRIASNPGKSTKEHGETLTHITIEALQKKITSWGF